ncbi:macro domain-containing protein [Nocardia nepalensis]|uniref:macro domain-containing protein n=1 Tax=Nocardia nepalensis TaxID=3375448 RepID=UPI003B66B3EA
MEPPTITETTGNLLDADTEALVNTVNTVGVMGKGIALEFRRDYPDMFEAYRNACERGDVQLGKMHVWKTGAPERPRYIINFPTKGRWRPRSNLSDIESGLTDLVKVVTELGITSIAIPPLGCGHGGLAWSAVRPLIVSAFSAPPHVDARVYPPPNEGD